MTLILHSSGDYKIYNNIKLVYQKTIFTNCWDGRCWFCRTNIPALSYCHFLALRIATGQHQSLCQEVLIACWFLPAFCTIRTKVQENQSPQRQAQLIPHKGVYVLRHFSEPCSDITLYLLTEVTCLVSATSLSRFLLLCWHFLRFSSRHISYTQILFSRSVSRKIPTKILVFKMPSFPKILISLKWGHRNVFGTHIWIATRPVTS